jgi:hypothetical protein
MNIGIDISQAAYEGTGVGKYVQEMIKQIVQKDLHNTYVLFGSSLRQRDKLKAFSNEVKKINPSVKIVIIPLPPTILDILWNQLHIIPITWFVGPLDIFWSSDWTQPPLGKAKGITTIHDVSFFRYPESFHKKIINVQKRRLKQVEKTCQMILCDSQTTKDDVKKYLNIPEEKLIVVYPGYHA